MGWLAQQQAQLPGKNNADRPFSAYDLWLSALSASAWVDTNEELVDKYHPDMLWFDMNGNDRSWDPLKITGLELSL